jgi:hypothetical protein
VDIRIYIGGHQATTEHFLCALKDNIDMLADEKISYLPTGVNTFNSIFKTSKAIKNGKNAKTARQQLLEEFNGIQDAEKLLIIDNRVIGQEHRAFEKELFYPRNSGFIKQTQSIFSGFNIRLFIETRSFTSLMPSYYSDMVFNNNAGSFDDLVSEINVEDLQWSSLIDRSQGRSTPLPATAWRYEDYPYIWRDVVGAITGLKKYQDLIAPDGKLDLSVDLQKAILFNKYTKKHPVQTTEEFEKLKALFLEQKTSAAKNRNSPNWSAERTQPLAHSYDDDWYYIERMDDVETILPRKLA